MPSPTTGAVEACGADRATPQALETLILLGGERRIEGSDEVIDWRYESQHHWLQVFGYRKRGTGQWAWVVELCDTHSTGKPPHTLLSSRTCPNLVVAAEVAAAWLNQPRTGQPT